MILVFFGRKIKRAEKTKTAFVAALLFLACLTAGAAAATAQTKPNGLGISKISFLIHPVCWDLALTSEGNPTPGYLQTISDMRGGSWYDDREFSEILAWEKATNKKQLEYIDRMTSTEALVILPIGAKPAMQEIIKHAESRLGKRCLVLRTASPSGNESVDYQKTIPSAVKIGLLDDLLSAVQKNEDSWSAKALEVIFFSRLIAMEIMEEFQKRSLFFDPQSVEAVAFGEGFEQCAMTWKAMLQDFLGMVKSIENDYDLSVSGMPLLRSASFKKRIPLDDDIRLFLWELKDGRPMALFVRAKAKLSDPQFFVTLPFEPHDVRVYDDNGKRLLSKPSIEFASPDSGPVTVPVFTAIRQYETNVASYIVVNNISFEQFEEKLQKADIQSRRK